MGFVMTKYDMLKDLEREQKSKRFSSIKLTAIVVHHEHDKELRNLIKTRFSRLARTTGRNFLFITFVQPDIAFEKLQNDPFLYAGEYLAIREKEYNESIEDAIPPLLRREFRIPDDGNSYIVLLNNGNTEGDAYVRTSADALSDQFAKITDYCEIPETSFKDLLNDLNARHVRGAIINSFSKIAKILALVSSSEINSDEQLQDALDYIQQFKRNACFSLAMTSKTSSQTISDEEAFYKAFEYYSNRIFEFYDVLAKSPIFHVRDRISEEYPNKNQLDANSLCFYESYLGLTKAEFPNIDGFDYSAFTLYLAKIIENEFNLSVYQMIRSACNIPMPQCYNKLWKEESGIKNVNLETGFGKKVDVNEAKKVNRKITGLRTRPLGDLLVLYKNLTNYNNRSIVNETKIISLSEAIQSFLKGFKDYRNDCAHMNRYTREQYEESKVLFEEFMKEFLPILADIKEKLSK